MLRKNGIPPGRLKLGSKGSSCPCPFCHNGESMVLDSRPCEGRIRRNRVCTSCGSRWTTYEVTASDLLLAPAQLKKLRAALDDLRAQIDAMEAAISKEPSDGSSDLLALADKLPFDQVRA